MSKAKRFYILIGVLLAVTVVTIAVSKYKTHKEEIKATGQTILEIPVDSVTLLSWDCQGNTLSFQKPNESWLYVDEENFPVNQGKIAELLKPLQQLGVFSKMDSQRYISIGDEC